MAKVKATTLSVHVSVPKKTSLDIKCPKTSSMNKKKRANFKKYRGQGRP